MATRAAVEVDHPYQGEVRIFKWEGITEADDGTPIQLPLYTHVSGQVIGDFDASGAMAIDVSMNPAETGQTFTPARDVDGTVISVVAEGTFTVRDTGYWYRPRATAGTAVNMDVWLIAVR